ncbi:uncharacterized protein CDAR_425821 [Caerostris darwini]|uniref:Uncharacterized protein n=1 Tax=Caerostris darwini TaxID=1538125 RepID=A0AAV4Q3B8_9ARAC|nr:uncharacterized protein CDAR_425821 [Caerostris darwini]
MDVNPCSTGVMSSDNTKCTQENIPSSLTNNVSEVSSNHEKTEIERASETNKKPGRICIPKLNYHTERSSRSIDELIYESYFNLSQEKPPFIRSDSRWSESIKPVLVFDPVLEMHRAPYVKCFSSNLHLLDNENSETQEVVPSEDFDVEDEIIFRCDLNVREDDIFYPWAENYVSFSIHSPFVPPNPFYEGNSLQEGYAYIVSVNLEEEHLQPAPYPTDCTDYIALWEKNNKTGPRSQEMCRAYCQLIYFRECVDCDLHQRVYTDSMKLCPMLMAATFSDPCTRERHKNIRECKMNCKPDCVHLTKSQCIELKRKGEGKDKHSERMDTKQAWNKLSDRVLDWDHAHISEGPNITKTNASERFNSGSLRFNVRVKGTGVSILSHNPVYGTWEVFSHVGGLVGCWLGISVWTAFNLFEDRYKSTVKLAFKMRNRSKRLAESCISPVLRQA